MTREEALALLEQRAQLAQSELASQTDAGEDVLHYLAQNGAVGHPPRRCGQSRRRAAHQSSSRGRR